MNKKKIEEWLDTLNEVSCQLEEYVNSPNDEILIHKLDKVIDELYDLTKGE